MKRKTRSDMLNEQVQAFIANGGQITKLREASITDQKKADRRFHHLSKSLEGDERSQQILDRENKKERFKIFSRTDRWKVD